MISKYGEDLLPKRSTKYSCGYDICIPFETKVSAGSTLVFDTGISLERGDIKDNECILILPRSSTSFKYGLKLLNTCAVIDSDYYKPIQMGFTVDKDCYFHRGDRIAQMIVMPYGLIAGEIEPTETRTSGIGSTGV